MARQLSFSKNEQNILPIFRQKINLAESTEDVKKFFAYTVKELFSSIFSQEIDMLYDDVEFAPSEDSYFVVSDRLLSIKRFTDVWNSSDLPKVVARFAKSAMNRYKRLEKHPEKTDAKIRMK